MTRSFSKFALILAGAPLCALAVTLASTQVAEPNGKPSPGPTQFFDQLVARVEQGKAPEDIVLTSVSGKASRPVCTYPKQVRYKGGDPGNASSCSL